MKRPFHFLKTKQIELSNTLTIIIFLTFLILNQNGWSQLVVSKTFTPQQLVQNILVGSGITVNNITYSGDTNAIGSFSGNTNLSLQSGILLTNGDIDLAVGPNNSNNASSNNNLGGDPDLTAISSLYSPSGNPINTWDRSVLEFDFVPQFNNVKLRYVFASEEYHEFANNEVNDVFAIFISGPGISGPYSSPPAFPGGSVNIAMIPGTTTGVSINTVNNGTSNSGPCMNCQYLVHNSQDSIQYDAWTSAFIAETPVIPNLQYHVKIAIADGYDRLFDSGVFLEENSFLSDSLQYPIITYIDDTIYACQNDNFTFTVNVFSLIGVSGFSLALNIDPSILSFISLQNINPVLNGGNFSYTQVGATIDINWDNWGSSVNILNDILFDLVFDHVPGNCPLIWDTITPGECEYTDSTSATIPALYINGFVKNTPPPFVELGNDTTICYNDTITLYSSNPGISYLWSTSETTDSIICSALIDTMVTYYLTVTDVFGCKNSDSITITFDTCSNPIYSISGKLTYDDTLTPNQPITNILLILNNINGITVDSTITDLNGDYKFNNLADGTYYIQTVSSKPWGGGNSSDALSIMNYFCGFMDFSDLKEKAGDIDGSGYINTLDALYLMQRFVLIINSFPIGDWVFENELISIKGNNVIYNYKGICTGDVNASYVVP